MFLFLFLLRASRWLLAAAVVASLACGVANVMLIASINRALGAPVAELGALAWRFAALAVLSMLAQMCAGALFTRLGQRTLAELRRHVSRIIVNAPLRVVESTGGARVQSVLADDANHVANFFIGLPTLVMNGAIVMGCFLYLAILSWPIFLMACVAIGLGALGYHISHTKVIRYLRTAGQRQDELFGHFQTLASGAKELKLNRRRADAFLARVLGSAIEAVRENRSRGLTLFIFSVSWVRFLFFALIGLVLFVLVGATSSNAHVATGYAIVFLYMVTPLEAMLNNIPLLTMARVASERIQKVTESMRTEDVTSSETSTTGAPLVRLHGITHSYYHEQQDEIFRMGPIDLTFRPGEITFLIGGNGSGKTSLAKLLTGLYVPESGEIVWNGQSVDVKNRDRYRQLFSAIFFDFHLFETLLGADDAQTDPARIDAFAARWLARLHLQHKVSVTNGAFSTRDLSQGQRKRLALVAACVEDRPFLVFDEWAADQDPVFKEVFYREILPELKAQGKTVLVISHDDRYFSLADRLVKMENGQLIADGEPTSVASTSANPATTTANVEKPQSSAQTP
ncbi:pandorabactin export ABC transporter PanG [Pandoraea sputorum]|uniref:Peptide ABC transporter n=2 Tax=Pandoraea sputorum TaxID=93222 RepID=A0A5E5B247_9BURK|nr:cyclic peptide export ABC transporter [Pandoraea sputorum]VVE79774.1 peptide ABC transporter [Pandoraea sputorum]